MNYVSVWGLDLALAVLTVLGIAGGDTPLLGGLHALNALIFLALAGYLVRLANPGLGPPHAVIARRWPEVTMRPAQRSAEWSSMATTTRPRTLATTRGRHCADRAPVSPDLERRLEAFLLIARRVGLS
jgi:hypothetical protein